MTDCKPTDRFIPGRIDGAIGPVQPPDASGCLVVIAGESGDTAALANSKKSIKCLHFWFINEEDSRANFHFSGNQK